MSIITRMRKQRAVYWEPTGRDKYNRFEYEDEPFEIRCRWEDKSERDVNELGEEVMVKSTVYVDRELVLGGVLWLGLLVDAPLTPPEHNRIRIFRAIPNLRASEFLWVARL